MSEANVSDRALLAFFKRPGAAAIVREVQASAELDAALAHRRELIARKEEILADAQRVMPALRATAGEKEALAKRAHAAADAADAAARYANGEVMSASIEFQAAVSAINATLAQDSLLVDKINDFVADLDRQFERERRLPVSTDPRPTGEGFFRGTMAAVTKVWSEAPSRARRLAAIRLAQQTAKESILEALTPDELATRLQELRDGLPAIVMEPVASDAAVETKTTRTPLRHDGAGAQ